MKTSAKHFGLAIRP